MQTRCEEATARAARGTSPPSPLSPTCLVVSGFWRSADNARHMGIAASGPLHWQQLLRLQPRIGWGQCDQPDPVGPAPHGQHLLLPVRCAPHPFAVWRCASLLTFFFSPPFLLPPRLPTSSSSSSGSYGRVEVEAKLPRGDWLWPAIWLLPNDQAYGLWPASGEVRVHAVRKGGAAARPALPGTPKLLPQERGSCAAAHCPPPTPRLRRLT